MARGYWNMTNINSIRTIVTAFPGHTAHWHKRHDNHYINIRNSWWYAAFERAVRAGAIRAADGPNNTTVYYPID